MQATSRCKFRQAVYDALASTVDYWAQQKGSDRALSRAQRCRLRRALANDVKSFIRTRELRIWQQCGCDTASVAYFDRLIDLLRACTNRVAAFRQTPWLPR